MNYACTLKLKDVVVPKSRKTRWTVQPRHVVIHMLKKYEGRWGCLLENKRMMKPFIKADFDLWCDEEDEEEKGGFDMSQFGKMMGGMGGMPGMGKDGMPDMATLQKMVAQEKAKQQGGGHGGYLPETCRPCPPSYNKGSCNMGSCSTKIEEADSDDDDMPELE